MNYLIDVLVGLQFIFRPGFWISNYKTDLTYDAWLREELAKPDPISHMSSYTCIIGGKRIWIGNFPYAFGNLQDPEVNVLPRRATRIQLQEKVLEHVLRKTD